VTFWDWFDFIGAVCGLGALAFILWDRLLRDWEQDR
jgi:hypothetical protein